MSNAEAMVRERYSSCYEGSGIWADTVMGPVQLGWTWSAAWRAILRADKLARRNQRALDEKKCFKEHKKCLITCKRKKRSYRRHGGEGISNG